MTGEIETQRTPSGPKKLRVLRKGVMDLPRRADISQAANARYLSAPAGVETSVPLSDVLDRLAKSRQGTGGRVRGLHPLTGADAQVAASLLRGEFTLNGFRKRNLRRRLFGDMNDTVEIRRQSAQVGRLLRLFREHGLIYKVRGTHRYQVSSQGRRVLPALATARHANTEKLQQLAT